MQHVIIKGIQWVGYESNSLRISSISNGIFFSQFINQGVILLLVNGNMTEHQPFFITKYINGQFYDYQPQWYSNVGFKIVYTMIISAFLPFINIFLSISIPFVRQLYDRDWGSDVYHTKTTTIPQYRELYGGEEYVIHFKFSDILTTIYITLMYGVGMPILFPIAAFKFINLYICERIVVAFAMK